MKENKIKPLYLKDLKDIIYDWQEKTWDDRFVCSDNEIGILISKIEKLFDK